MELLSSLHLLSRRKWQVLGPFGPFSIRFMSWHMIAWSGPIPSSFSSFQNEVFELGEVFDLTEKVCRETWTKTYAWERKSRNWPKKMANKQSIHCFLRWMSADIHLLLAKCSWPRISIFNMGAQIFSHVSTESETSNRRSSKWDDDNSAFVHDPLVLNYKVIQGLDKKVRE